MLTPDQETFILLANFRNAIQNVDATLIYSFQSSIDQYCLQESHIRDSMKHSPHKSTSKLSAQIGRNYCA